MQWICAEVHIPQMEYASNIFAALSDPIRLRCVALLARYGELCVCELTHALQASQPKISKHMAVLRDAGIVADRRNAQWVLYRLTAELPGWAADAVTAAATGASATSEHAGDCARLDAMAARPPRTRVA